MIGTIVYSYNPPNWDQEAFLALGGFDVVFLNYNKAKYVERSVASALAQDFPLCEMFFMDDASTDGSGDTMERLVREYRGRHKVTVVRNTENQHICGQWNIVSKLATGNWLGMFCGDDVAHVDRVSKVAEIIKACPSLRGVCTSARTVDAGAGVVGGRIGDAYPSEGCCGIAAPLDFATRSSSAIGATTFYRRELFDAALPFAPLDDELLRWIEQLKGAGDPNVVWKFVMDVDTVDYTCGSGISTQGGVKATGHAFSAADWRKANEGLRRFTGLKLRSELGVREYFDRVKAPLDFRMALEVSVLRCRSVLGNTLSRVFYVMPMLAIRLLLCSGSWINKMLIFKAAVGDLMREFYGVKCWSYVQAWRSRRKG